MYTIDMRVHDGPKSLQASRSHTHIHKIVNIHFAVCPVLERAVINRYAVFSVQHKYTLNILSFQSCACSSNC